MVPEGTSRAPTMRATAGPPAESRITFTLLTARISAAVASAPRPSASSAAAAGLQSGSGMRRRSVAPALLGARRADRGLDVLALLGRRQHGLHAERLQP